MRVRTADATDDLSKLWPALGRSALNRDQVLVAYDDENLVGGLVYWDAGHDMVFVGEFTLLPETRNPVFAAYKLLLAFQERLDGKQDILFHCQDDKWAALATKGGARVLENTRLMAVPVSKFKESVHGRSGRR